MYFKKYFWENSYDPCAIVNYSNVVCSALSLQSSVFYNIQSFAMPLPFSRVLNEPSMNGSDVLIAQYLLSRSSFITSINKTSEFDNQTVNALKLFQSGNNLNATGQLDSLTANVLLNLHLQDNFKDPGGLDSKYKYKVVIPVYRDRYYETNATLWTHKSLAAEHNLTGPSDPTSTLTQLHSFKVHAHGQLSLNQLSDDGSTPTGMSEFDLNTPEPDPTAYGPFNINRFTNGLGGNSEFLISGIRDGILMHTGEWKGWTSEQEMPNSHGCVHGHYEDIGIVAKLLGKIGVVARENPFGERPYPFQSQGIVVVEQID